MRRLVLLTVVLAAGLAAPAIAKPTPSQLRVQGARAWRQALRDCQHYAGCARVTFWWSQQGAHCSHYWFFYSTSGPMRWVDSLQCPAGMVSHGGGAF